MAVSSAELLMIVLLDCGISVVYIVYNSGHMMLPCGTPESIGSGREVKVPSSPQN